MPNYILHQLSVGQLQSNCYLLINDQTKSCVIIDPGDDADYITRIISQEQVKPEIILATHGHFDHIMAATELKLAFHIPFTIHPKDQFLVNQLQKSAQHFLIGVEPVIPPSIDQFLNRNSINLAGLKFQIIHTPGHTPGSVSLYSQNENLCFVGDLLFQGGDVGRFDFSYSNQKDLHHSIEKIMKLPPQTTLLPGHGPVTTVEAEALHHH